MMPLHWKRQRNAQMHPGMSLAERREAQHYAAINQQLPRKRDGQWGWLEPGGMTQSAAPVRYNMRQRSTWRG